MTTGEKISKLRRENNVTQEQLAALLGVSRQSVSKWESDTAYPETEKLIRLADFFHVTVDELLREKNEPDDSGRKGSEPPTVSLFAPGLRERFHYEYRSERTLFGLPLVHVNLGLGAYRAKGIVSVGMLSAGFLSVGLLSAGLVSVGVLSLGLLALGVGAVGMVALAAIALGLLAVGAVAVGVFSLGAVSVGLFSAGALACGRFVAVGDWAYGTVAVGKTRAFGSAFEMLRSSAGYSAELVKEAIRTHLSAFWRSFAGFVTPWL